MFKKTLLSLAVASSVGLTGCLDDSSVGGNANPDYKVENENFAGKTWPVFNPAAGNLPVPSDIQFAQETAGDGTLAPNEQLPAIDFLDGASTTAQYDIKLNGSINPKSVDGRATIKGKNGAPVPNPNQNVFLLGLDYPSGDPLLNDSSQYKQLIEGLVEDGVVDSVPETVPGETPTFDLGLAFNKLKGASTPGEKQAAVKQIQKISSSVRTDVIDLDGGTDNVIRLSPLSPLTPKKKYLVVITDEVKDNAGDPLIASPSYQSINSEGDLVSADLQGVRSAVSGWERLASGYFSALTNPSRKAAGKPTLDGDDIALSLTFTTGGTTDVLEAATSPAQFFADQQTTTVKQTAIAEYLADNAAAFGEMSASEQYETLLTKAKTAVATENASAPTIGMTAAGTVTSLAGSGADFSNPESRNISLISGTRVADSQTLGFPEAGTIVQASIELPYFLQIPDQSIPQNKDAKKELAADLSSNWTASTNVGTLIEASQGSNAGETPPSDKVTYRFPFPGNSNPDGSRRTVTAPLLISAPAASSGCSKPMDVVIYQHGIFGSRADSLSMANQLGAKCFVTVAMDLPYHGIAPRLGDGRPNPFIGFSLDKTVIGGEYKDNPLAPQVNERHFGWTQNSEGNPERMTYSTNDEKAMGQPGQYFLNLEKLPAARDNLRQGIVDMLNLNASLDKLNGLDLNGDGNTNDVNFTGNSDVHFVGHSLGGILGVPYVALVNGTATESTIGNDNLTPFKTAAFVTPGAGVAKLLENSPNISQTVLPALAEKGLTQGTSTLELFLNVAQASIDSAEPHNFASTLKESGVPVYINEIYGDGSSRNSQDQTIPVAADERYSGQYTRPLGEALPAPLAGTEPLIEQLGASQISATGAADAVNVVRFTDGSHTTVISGEPVTVFGDMATNLISFFTTDGASIKFNNAANVRQSAP